MKFEHTVWSEKYRPQTIDECILPIDLKKSFSKFVALKDVPNMILTGTPGVGKTTIAKALCNELNCDYIMINGSDESGIDVLRNKIKNFASTVSLSGGLKVVIIDEADNLNSQSTQPAMRSFMEEFSNNCRFILTCNYKRKIIEPLISRCTVFEFHIPSNQRVKLAVAMLKRLESILQKEQVEYNEKVLAELIKKFYPDFRKTISEVQRYVIQNGKLDIGILSDFIDVSIEDLITALKNKNFNSMRTWVNENLDKDPNNIVRVVFDSLEKVMEPSSIPHAILILSNYAYKSAFVSDHELNMTAMFIEIMAECVFI